jgi:transposase
MAKRGTKIKALKESGSFNAHAERVKAPLFQNSDFFDPYDLLQVKYEMLRQVLVEHTSKAETAKLFGVSRPTFYEAESAFLREGLAGLLPQRRGPKEAHKLDAKVMTFVEKCIKENQNLRTKELIKLIHAHFNITVHQRSIERAISRKKKFRNKQ